MGGKPNSPLPSVPRESVLRLDDFVESGAGNNFIVFSLSECGGKTSGGMKFGSRQ